MKRDMDLVRKILLAGEQNDRWYLPELSIDGFTKDMVNQHIHLMVQAGLLETIVAEFDGGRRVPQGTVMTWAGYDFLESSRSEETWARAKHIAMSTGGMTLDVLKAVLSEMAIHAIKRATGMG